MPIEEFIRKHLFEFGIRGLLDLAQQHDQKQAIDSCLDYVVKTVVSNFEKRLDETRQNCYLYGNELSQYVLILQEKMKLQENLPLPIHRGLEVDKKFKL